MMELEYLSKDTIARPMTPSYWVGEPKYKEVTRIKMTCGGGMGGSVWFEDVDRISLETIDYSKNKFITVNRALNGKEITINPNYIVCAENYTLVSAKYNSQNSNFKTGLWEIAFLIRDGKKITLSDGFAQYNYKGWYCGNE